MSNDNNSNDTHPNEPKSFEEELRERRERRKNNKRENKHSILANYYNLQKKVEKKSAPGDLDGNNFDPKVYFDKVLSKKAMPELIEYDLKLKGAIQKLDNNMKTLVYDNYNKFISATQTIKDMKENVKSMDEKMNMLKKNMEKITNISGGINNTLEKRRGTIQELGEVYRLLKGRQFLFDLPSRLKKDIEFEAYDDAVKYFNLTHHVFETYKHLPSFSSIYEECEQTIKLVRDKLYEQIEDTKAPLSKTKNAIDLLLQLGEKPLPLREIYLERSKKNIDSVIKSSTEILEQEEKKKEEGDKKDVSERQSKEGEEKKEEGENKEVDEEDTLKEEDDDNAPVIVSKLSSHILPVCLKQFKSYEELFITTTVAFKIEEKQHSEVQFRQYAKEVINKFYELLSPHLANCDDALEFVHALEVMEKKLYELDSQIDMTIEEIIDSCVIDAVVSYTEKDYKQLSNLIEETIDNLEVEMLKKLEEPKKENTEGKEEIELVDPPKSPKKLENVDLSSFCKSVYDNITVNIKKFLENLKPFVAKKGNFLSKHAYILMGSISEKLRILLISIQKQSTLNYQKDPTKELINSRFRYQLLLANVLKGFGTNGIKEITKTISILHSLANVKLHVNFDRFSDKFIHLSRDILKNYVLSNGRNVSKMVRGSIEVFDWMNPKLGVPRDVRNAICVVVNNIQQIFEEVSSTIGKEKSHNKNSSQSNYKSSMIEHMGVESPGGSRDSRIEDQLTRMFKDKIMIFDKSIEFKADEIIVSILKIFLKSFYETIRLRTFNQNAFHQLQVDIHYIKTILTDIVSPQKFEIIDSLLSEAYASAVDRCVEPSNLAKTILINICESRLKHNVHGGSIRESNENN